MAVFIQGRLAFFLQVRIKILLTYLAWPLKTHTRINPTPQHPTPTPNHLHTNPTPFTLHPSPYLPSTLPLPKHPPPKLPHNSPQLTRDDPIKAPPRSTASPTPGRRGLFRLRGASAGHVVAQPGGSFWRWSGVEWSLPVRQRPASKRVIFQKRHPLNMADGSWACRHCAAAPE